MTGVISRILPEHVAMQEFDDAEDDSKHILLFALEILCRASKAGEQKARKSWPNPLL